MPPSKPGSRFRLLFARLVLALGSFLFTAFCLELALQWLHRNDAYTVSPGPNSTYEMQQPEFREVVRTNSLNMREDEIHPRREGEERVLFLGDSFTFGLGVAAEKSFPERLPSLLSRNGRALYAINAGGRGGYSHLQYEFLRQYADALDPDFLVVQLYVGNDFADAFEDVVGAADASKNPFGNDSAFRAWMRERHIYTLEMLWGALIRIDWIDDFLLRRNLRYAYRTILLKHYPPLEQALVNQVLAGFAELGQFARERGLPMIVVIVPSKIQVWKRDALDDRFDPERPNRIVREFCESKGLPVLDLLEAYARVPQDRLRSFFYQKDMHWTASGHEHAAQTLADFLVSLGIGFERRTTAGDSLETAQH